MRQSNAKRRSPGQYILDGSRFLARDFRKYKYIYLMIIPVLLYYILFHYWPMYGAQIAFKTFSPKLGIVGSPWVGFKNFQMFFNSAFFVRILRNTVLISVYSLIWGFPLPIILALLLNELRSKTFKSIVQTISYLPHFISIMVVCGMVVEFTSLNGLINDFIVMLGGTRTTLLLRPELFRTIYVTSTVWQQIGWNSIIFLAALSGIDQQLYEAAVIDGAGRWKQMLNVTLPGLLPTIVVMLILRVGQIMNVGFERIILLYNPTNYETSDVISSFVYRKGLLESSFSYSAAVGLFNSVVNFTLLLTVNKISKQLTENSLW